jgi:hypothetical protein
MPHPPVSLADGEPSANLSAAGFSFGGPAALVKEAYFEGGHEVLGKLGRWRQRRLLKLSECPQWASAAHRKTCSPGVSVNCRTAETGWNSAPSS